VIDETYITTASYVGDAETEGKKAKKERKKKK